MTDIGWFPYEGEFMEGCPFTTHGLGFHEGDPDRGGLDPEIADLVEALNAAGVPTLQSCQEITADTDPDVCRMGAVLVPWADFPKVDATLPDAAGPSFSSGWLFAADRQARHVTVIFPWRDHDAWLAKLATVHTDVPVAT